MKTKEQRHALADKLTGSIGKPPDLTEAFAALDAYVEEEAQAATKRLEVKPLSKHQMMILRRVMRLRAGLTNRVGFQRVHPRMLGELIAALIEAGELEPQPTDQSDIYGQMDCDDLVDEVVRLQIRVDVLNTMYAEQCGGGLTPDGFPPPAVMSDNEGNELPTSNGGLRCARMANVRENELNNLDAALAQFAMRCSG